ncbi:MAG: WbqC family protein [Thermodesulfobacteriota bacterium]
MPKKTKKVAILQSNYIPWKGYFDLINMVDEFILYDDVKYTKNDWRNRNLIKTPNGLQWLTIPIYFKGKSFQKIKDAKISNRNWNIKHWKTIVQNYSKSKYFKEYREIFEPLYLECKEEFLSRVNHRFIKAICPLLGIGTKISWSMDYSLAEGKTERLVALCRDAGAGHYISGPAAKDYMEEELFEEAGIGLSYMDYSGYPEYTQLFGKFEHGVSIIDLIFNAGPEAKKYMLSF